MAIATEQRAAGRDRQRRRDRLLAVLAVLWTSVYLVGGSIAVATGHSASAQIGLAAGGFFTVTNLVAWWRRRVRRGRDDR
jgi:hypothetical protein